MKWFKIKPCLFSILLALGVGGLAGFLTRNSMAAYHTLRKPRLNPPDLVFPIVWTILFVLMGLGAAMVLKARTPKKKTALTVYGIQLAVNFCWSILFFNLRLYAFSFFWLLALWGLILAMIRTFYTIKPAAGLLQIPYLLWVAFAGYLNLGIWLLNR